MNVYLLLDLPIIGELGEATETLLETLCESCGKRRRVYTHIEYCFDRWDGEDLIGAYGLYFISERLKQKVDDKNIKGVKLTKVQTSKSDNFYFSKMHINKKYLIFIMPKLREEPMERNFGGK